ncbi:MAG: hypothetical protein V4550_02555 [Gemmatimonadota bacterium]
MKPGILKMYDVETQASAPQYELRARNWSVGDDELEIWQLPSPATPHIRSAVRVAGLRGRNLDLVHHRVLRRLTNAGVKLRSLRTPGLLQGEPSSYAVTEHLALMLGLLFRTLAPMRSRENMLRVAEGIEAMGQEEAAYWLGMAMHRVNPRRVLSALRMLLTDPSRRTDGAR